ncbi:hypothetical protein ACFWM0_04925 [Streptomyces sp. NPDC058405]
MTGVTGLPWRMSPPPALPPLPSHASAAETAADTVTDTVTDTAGITVS